jgi:hypothetical protein
MTMSARTALDLVWCSGEDTMGIPIEIPPFLDLVLTLSAMLALFAYVYRLAGKEGPFLRWMSGEIKLYQAAKRKR